MVLNSKNKAILSAIAVVISSLLLALDLFGVIPFIILVLAFFTLVIQSALYFAGYKDGDVFEAYQEMERTEATALANLAKDKKQCVNSDNDPR
ncbi:hypothetical protein L1D54_03215 [Vibrio brasiliensis]|jgi:hypothetical protein|uniref:Uncharacterized protein n=1 Tax=Vibrio brasiliensis LMG 20546 TaxID=945543 RepID=E8LZY2_9VIBR|nr:hypothetical protein [Vibrio brasiliensis]EGA63729.1 hypothetical protein VIBR0546_21395 [Vibrio brasiliensis LMG 20546]MCG9648942.1 hypothetical protein [Vibrio brasiliensis]MCG9749475.1 hypothetical protein [Vibrio brasiliensis]MCG9782920.1 hypothetical protein [Vibrio brasiliensis]